MLVRLFATPPTTQSMEFSRAEYKNAEVGSHSILQGIFPAQRLNPGLLHCRWILFFFFAGGKLQNSLPAEPPGRDFQLNDSLYDSTF